MLSVCALHGEKLFDRPVALSVDLVRIDAVPVLHVLGQAILDCLPEDVKTFDLTQFKA